MPDFLIRAGVAQLDLAGTVSQDKLDFSLSLHLDRRGNVSIKGENWEQAREAIGAHEKGESPLEYLISPICGMSADPVLAESFLLFHSHRKVQEGNPE